MEPILITFTICLVGVIGAAALFSVAMRGHGREDQGSGPSLVEPPTHAFFMDGAADSGMKNMVPGDTLLLDLERHFRMEERVAEAFLAGPSPETLHAPSHSPWWG